jgi:hypothetical protein
MVVKKNMSTAQSTVDAKTIALAQRALLYFDVEYATINSEDVPAFAEAVTGLVAFLKELCEVSHGAFAGENVGPRAATRFRKLVREFLVIRSKMQTRESTYYYDPITRTVSFPDNLDRERCHLLKTLKELRFCLEDKALD